VLQIPPSCPGFLPAARTLSESSGLALAPVVKHSKTTARKGKKMDQRYISDCLHAGDWARGLRDMCDLPTAASVKSLQHADERRASGSRFFSTATESSSVTASTRGVQEKLSERKRTRVCEVLWCSAGSMCHMGAAQKAAPRAHTMILSLRGK